MPDKMPTVAPRRPRIAVWADRIAFAALLALIAGYALYERPFWRPVLRVRSCGGNFDLLCAYNRDFERRHACRVQYVAAPVQYLLELALRDERHLPDVLVGRSGPGWELLSKRGRLAGPRVVFAVDPLVIATPLGNPAAVHSLEDLGREGVRVAASPGAMRPKGKVIAQLMSKVSSRLAPGLEDRWERNTVVEVKCGRLLGRAIAEGRADAAVVPLSLTRQRPLRGHCQIVRIPVKVLDLLTFGRGSLPQSAARTTRGANNDLAAAYLRELTGPEGRERLIEQGYVPAGSPEFGAYKPLLKPFTPTPMAPRQMALAQALDADGIPREAVRRYLKVIHTFGPSRWDAEAWVRAGTVLARAGDATSARIAWHTALDRFPTRGRKEHLHTFYAIQRGLGDPESQWIARAREHLKETPRARGAMPPPVEGAVPAPIRVREGDLPKGARRDLALAIDLLRLGNPDFAIRDALKVCTLHYPSPHMPAARALVGAALLARGDTDGAREQWARVCSEFPRSRWAQRCRHALARVPSDGRPNPHDGMPPFVPVFDSHTDRGMTYAWELWRAGLPLLSLKEYFKVLVGIYPGERSAYAAEARFRAGVCLATMGRAAAAAAQWRACVRLDADGPWGRLARERLARLGTVPPLVRQAIRQRLRIPAGPSEVMSLLKPRGPRAKTLPALQRLRLGEELLSTGVMDEGQAVQEFLKVLNVVRVPPNLRAVRSVAHVRAAQALLRAGEPERAGAHLAAAVQCDQSKPVSALIRHLREVLTEERTANQ